MKRNSTGILSAAAYSISKAYFLRHVLQSPRWRPFWAVGALALTGVFVGWTTTSQAPAPPKRNVIMGGSKYTGVPKGKPVKIALVTDVAGKQGSIGPNVVKGAKLMVGLANKNGGIRGRPVKLILRDDGADPANTTRLTQELFRTQDPDMLLGSANSSTLLAQASLVQQFHVPAFTTSSSDVQWVGKQASIYQGMTIPSSRDDACATAKFISVKHKNWKRIALFTVAFAYGDDYARDFRRCLARVFPAAKVVEHKKFNADEQNFLPFINVLLASKPNFIVGTLFGLNAVRFYKQYRGVGGKVPFSEVLTDLEVTRSIGKVPPRFLYDGATRTRYTELGKTANPWIKAFKKKYGDVPSGDALQTIGTFLAYKATVEKARTFDALKVMQTWRCMRYYEPRGWVRVRAINGQADVPNFIGSFMRSRKFKDLILNPADRLAVYSHDTWASDAQLRGVMPKDAIRSRSQCK